MFVKIISFLMSVLILLAQFLGLPTLRFDFYVYNNASYGEHERHKLDLYIPRNVEQAGLVLFIHGGAWIGGDKSSYEDTMKQVAEDFGCACASINYRYICEDINLNDLADDIDSALAFIKLKGAEKGVEINKVLLTGGSAGAHLSLFYAYSRKDTAPIVPTAVVSDCGPTDLTDDYYFYNEDLGKQSALGGNDVIALLMSWAGGKSVTYETRAEASEALRMVSPLYYVDENTVPTVINHGMKDDVVPFRNAVELDKKLTEYGVTHVFNIYPNSDHGLSSDPENMSKAHELFYEYIKTYVM